MPVELEQLMLTSSTYQPSSVTYPSDAKRKRTWIVSPSYAERSNVSCVQVMKPDQHGVPSGSGFAGFEFFAGVLDLEPGIANFGHLGGILFGAGMMLYWRWKEKRETEPGFEDTGWVWESW